MTRLTALALATATLAGLAPAAEAAVVPRRPDMPAYQVVATWTPATRTLAGTEQISFRNAGTDALGQVWIRVWPNGWKPVGSSAPPAGCGALRATRRGHRAAARLGSGAVGCTAYRMVCDRPLPPGARGAVASRSQVPRAARRRPLRPHRPVLEHRQRRPGARRARRPGLAPRPVQLHR